MSNLSDIGFRVSGEQDVNQVLMDILPLVKPRPCPPHGYYFVYSDPSGAQIFLQTNPAQEIIGFNPAFGSKSSRRADVISVIERDSSELDGGFLVRTPHENEFVFDSPEFRLSEAGSEESSAVRLCAFASNDLKIFGDDAGQSVCAVTRILPDEDESLPPQPHAKLTARIKESERRKNELSGEWFWWMLVETPCGELDLVADTVLIKEEPVEGMLAGGSFWLSGTFV